YFEQAKYLATKATQQFVQAIVADIQSVSIPAPQTADKAICGLLTGDDHCGGIELLVQTGVGSYPPNGQAFTAFDSKVSVNSAGQVGFTGFLADGTNGGYIVSDPSTVRLVTFLGSATRVYGGASINDAVPPALAFQERVSGAPPTFFVRRWGSDGQSVTV